MTTDRFPSLPLLTLAARDAAVRRGLSRALSAVGSAALDVLLSDADGQALLRADQDSRNAARAAAPALQVPTVVLPYAPVCPLDSPTPRTTAAPTLGTPDADAAISERLQVIEISEDVADGYVTVQMQARLWTGAACHGAHWGRAVSGLLEDYGTVRADARSAADRACRDARTALRLSDAVLGSDVLQAQPVGLPVGGRAYGAACLQPVASPVPARLTLLSGEDYAWLRSMVQRRAYGNAAGGSRSAHVRAGLTASGMPVQPCDVQDALSAAVLILARWGTDGLPEGLSQTVSDWKEDGQDVRPLLLGSAARDGLRMVTGSGRPTAAATAAQRYRAAVQPSSLAPVVADAPMPSVVGPAARLTNPCPVRVSGSTSYVAAGTASPLLDVLLSRTVGADGASRLRFPVLAAFVLLDAQDSRSEQGTAAVARLLLGSASGAARRTIGKRARLEWSAAQALRECAPFDAADDSADAADDMTRTR